jgi:hypothetical protein
MYQSQLQLKDASFEEIAKVASDIIYKDKIEKKILSLKDVSGNSGAKTFICSDGDIPKCIVKVKGNESIMSSHSNTFKRVSAATEILRSNGIAPPILLKGGDFHIEKSAGISVMEDFFHFNKKLAPPEKVSKLLSKLHSTPINWYQDLKNEFLEQDLNISSILKPMPAFAPCWCLPWSGFDTQMPVLGVGNPNPETAKKIFKLEIKTGVYKKIMQCSAFFPKSDAAKREVVVHNDFKPDNILYDPETKELTVIDYDLVQVGAAVMDFGLPYMMWLGSRFTNFNLRKEFIKSYLIESQLPFDDENVKDMMLDCEINTIVAFPGLLANIYDAEIPLLRGIEHPTAKADYLASGLDASPTGLELVDLLAEAVEKIRSDDNLIISCLENGLVVTMFENNGFGSKQLNSWLKEMQKNKMLRLFGIAETDGGELFVADHAKK